MGTQKRNGSNLSIRLTVIIIILALIGTVCYFFVYEPYFESERDRLQTFTTDLDPVTLDPAYTGDTDSNSIILNIYDRLVQYSKNSTEVEPSLAVDWTIPDSRTYIFYLRDDVKFHDSTPFNASSVKFSFERTLEIGEETGEGPSYILSEIENIEIIDTYTVKITLIEDFAPFLQVMAHPGASIVSQSAVEKYGAGYSLNPVGTGPFLFDSWDEVVAKELVLVANNEYFKGAPLFQKLVFKVIVEASDREQELLAGNLDAVFTAPPGVPVEDLEALDENPDVEIIGGAGSDIEYLGFNTLIEPLNDLKVRQAIAYAINYDAIINDVLGGHAERIGGPIPPTIFGYKNISLTQRDVNKARQLLSEAGYPDGFSVELLINRDNLARSQTADVIKSNLKEIGIAVTVVSLEWNDLLGAYFSMDYEMTINKWVPDYFDADAYLMPQFHTLAMQYAFNVYGFSDPEVDALIEQARSTLDPNVRQQAYEQAQETIAAQLPMVFLYVPDLKDIVRFDIGGWEATPTGFIYAYDLYRR